MKVFRNELKKLFIVLVFVIITFSLLFFLTSYTFIQKQIQHRLNSFEGMMNEYITLEHKKMFDFSKTYSTILNGSSQEFISSTPSIIFQGNNFIMNTRYIAKNVSLNSRRVFNLQFQAIGEEVFLTDDYKTIKPYMGVEDIRLYSHKNSIIFSANWFDIKTNLISVVKGHYNVNSKALTYKVLTPSFVNKQNNEKNWVYFTRNNTLYMIYSWYPLHICIEHHGNQLKLVEIKETPAFFMDLRGNTSAVFHNNEIWFICHKNQNGNYVHLFVVFDTSMNLKRYSSPFKFFGDRVEFCLGFCILNDDVYISYSNSDITTKVSIYKIDYIEKTLQWTTYTDNVDKPSKTSNKLAS
jgi:hypothetical protein